MSRRARQRQAAMEARYLALIPEPDENGRDDDDSDFEMLSLYEAGIEQQDEAASDEGGNPIQH